MSRRASLAVVVALAAGGCGAEREARDIPAPLAPVARTTATATATAAPGRASRPRSRRRPARASPPVRLVLPSIGVDAALVPLGLDAHHALEVPVRFDVAGWWTGGARPGEPGPAVLAGHVDSKTGPAVFYELGQLQRGDAVLVRRRDGSSVRFIVQGQERYSKDRFPTARVYGPTRRPTLRLITCSGQFDRSTGHYLDNTVVYASA